MPFIIPFEGRNSSGAYNVNFLYRDKNVFVMDNHRLAMWCWLQYFNSNSDSFNLFHLDRHTDCLSSHLANWVAQSLSPLHVESMSISDYVSKIDSQSKVPLYRWDNYLSIFLEIYKNKIGLCRFATYQGDKPNHSPVYSCAPWEIPDNLDFYMRSGAWICNVDLDYFFHALDDDHVLMYSVEYIGEVFKKIDMLLQGKNISVLTVCFSPECCGGWSNAERVWAIAEKHLKTGLLLP